MSHGTLIVSHVILSTVICASRKIHMCDYVRRPGMYIILWSVNKSRDMDCESCDWECRHVCDTTRSYASRKIHMCNYVLWPVLHGCGLGM